MTTSVTYTLLDPTGNITLLVETPVPEASQPLVAKTLMALEPETEQVGFVSYERGEHRLRMAGGEFCGNASMSAAALQLLREGRTEGIVALRVSGAPEPVTVVLKARGENAWSGTVTMPRPLSVGKEHFPDGRALPVVRFPGIAHVILEENPDLKQAEQLAPVWCRELGAEALGLMFLDREKKELKPLVYVPEAETLFWESSCASGTTAVGAYFAAASGEKVCLPLTQPGGTLEIAAEPEGTLLLTGAVHILRRVADVTV
ncbi:MAG: hypothetical protein IJV40_11120 [Oscillospiraceae bacterium]|nr:hypothetical protein [Oscillospiraceae bacterium]